MSIMSICLHKHGKCVYRYPDIYTCTNNSVKNRPILIIFGTQNPNKMWCKWLCPPHMKKSPHYLVKCLFVTDLMHHPPCCAGIIQPSLNKSLMQLDHILDSWYTCCSSHPIYGNTLDLGQGLLDRHISWLMNKVSHGTEARPCRECDVLVHYLAGRQTCHQQCRRWLAAKVTLLSNIACSLKPHVQQRGDWYNQVSMLQQRLYRLVESAMHAKKTEVTGVTLHDCH